VPNRREMMLRLTHTVARLPADDPLPLRMCVAFVQIVDAKGGSIAVGFASSERTLLCATDETSSRYEDAQDFLREGPSLDAFRTGRLVASLSVEDQEHRWPGLVSSLSRPASTIRAIPIRPGSAVMGVLTVHDGPHMMKDEEQLSFLADAIGAAILGDLPTHDDESRLWSERDRVSQATGMIIAQLGIGPTDALALLRAHAFAHEISVVEVSRSVVDRTLDFSRPDRGEAS
jgi:hypothetical protein